MLSDSVSLCRVCLPSGAEWWRSPTSRPPVPLGRHHHPGKPLPEAAEPGDLLLFPHPRSKTPRPSRGETRCQPLLPPPGSCWHRRSRNKRCSKRILDGGSCHHVLQKSKLKERLGTRTALEGGKIFCRIFLASLGLEHTH